MATPKKQAKPFFFKQFTIHQDKCSMKVGTDGVMLGAWADTDGVERALDIGAGSGLIAIMLGQRSAHIMVDAVEIDEPSYEQARENMAQAPWSSRLRAFHTSIQDFSREAAHQYQLIVSNPPFFSGGTFSDDHNRANVRHAIKLPHGDLLSAVRSLLSPEGKFCLVLPYIEGLRFQELAESYHLHCTRMTEVYPKQGKPVERLLMQFERQGKSLEKDSLVIQKEQNNDWTAQYIKMTGAFYLNM
ncbi:MAG: methyltransferase [Lewinellaceae bacterium]|nr:methyltransferase [Lewinellaceae bacterium]